MVWKVNCVDYHVAGVEMPDVNTLCQRGVLNELWAAQTGERACHMCCSPYSKDR